MKHTLKHVLVAACLATLMACGGKKMLVSENNTAKAAGVLGLSVAWVKPKGNKFDIHFSIKDESESKSLIVYLHDINCYRGATMGEMKHKFFGAGEKVIDLKIGQTKKFTLGCNHGTDATGPVRIVIAKVYDNPTHDGKVPGKVIATNIEWKGMDPSAEAAPKAE